MIKTSLAAEFLFDTMDSGVVAFSSILQAGFKVNVHTGVSIRDLLCNQFDVNPDYVEDRIRTAFLNGKPVDDFSTAIMESGATLALSAAMPGLVGATFRKGGDLAVFRGTITHRRGDTIVEERLGVVSIKLFNLLAKEIGLTFLKRGVMVDSDTARWFFSDPPDAFRRGCKSILVNGEDIHMDQLSQTITSGSEGFVELRLMAS
ncbi:MAG: hypothetical protein HN366_17710 [Deltaproteobacteria bacterium]|nr:hypothetical protein [Deltaproteobacteria bacterium]